MHKLLLFVFLLSCRALHADDIQISVGITPTCPYGLTGCWAGAMEALQQLESVDSVTNTPDAYNCTGLIRTKDGALPDPEKWRTQFAKLVGKQYIFRGIELTMEGDVEVKDGSVFLKSDHLPKPLLLKPLQNKLQWNFAKQHARGAEKEEAEAYQQLQTAAQNGPLRIKITGPLQFTATDSALEVREFFALTPYRY